MHLTLERVDEENWRDVSALTVNADEARFVASPAYYLCLCHYGGLWHPLAICVDGVVVGFLMWAIDPVDASCWLGGIIVDRHHRRKGYGRGALNEAIRHLSTTRGIAEFALSYEPDNGARRLYRSIGFVETGEQEGDEVVARYRTTPQAS